MGNSSAIILITSLFLYQTVLATITDVNTNAPHSFAAALKERESNGGLNGTCYTSNECAQYGGSAYGSCASGFGVCCVVTISSCGSSTSLNGTYWTNPGYSSSYTTAGECTLAVTKCSSNICQLRLDFIVFNIAQPDSSSTSTAGRCLIDVFTISGQSNVVPAICGINTNQHIYLGTTPGQDTFTLSMTLSGTTTSRYWDIRISQIPCGANYAAPADCLQYFMDVSGTVMSFNYLFSTVSPIQHLAFQDYTVCVRTNSGYCGIEWLGCTSTGGAPAFAISAAGSSLASFTCVTDFVMFQCISDVMNSIYLAAGYICNAKLCGIYLNPRGLPASSAPGYSYTTPFFFRFHSDGNEQSLTAGESYGFCIQYNQLPCSTTAVASG